MAGSVTVKSPEEMSPREYMGLALRTERTPEFIALADDKPGAWTDASTFARLIHGAIGLCTEAGELQDAIKRRLIYNKPLDRVNIIEEIGDLLWYCALVLDSQGATFEEAMERNIAKLRVRFPDKFSFEAANVRDLAAERRALEAAPMNAPSTLCGTFVCYSEMARSNLYCTLPRDHEGRCSNLSYAYDK